MQVILISYMTIKDGQQKPFAEFKTLPDLSAVCNNCLGVSKQNKCKTPQYITDSVDLVFQNF